MCNIQIRFKNNDNSLWILKCHIINTIPSTLQFLFLDFSIFAFYKFSILYFPS